MNKFKIILFSLIPLFVLLISSEFILRVIYFQSHSDNKLALISVSRNLRTKLANWRADQLLIEIQQSPLKGVDLLYSQLGAELLADLKKQYEVEFKRLLEETQKIDSKLIVLYAPGDDYFHSATIEDTRSFFGALTKKYGIEFVDMTSIFQKYDIETVTLAPQNGHLSRFGNRLIAEELAKRLVPYFAHRSSHHFDQRPAVMGDLAPNDDRIWLNLPSIPYRVVSNAQGFRMDRDIQFPKTTQRILALGDSMTFGPYISVFDSYPYLLNRKLKDREVINAGIAGYTITDESELFREKAKYSEPDVTILEVLDNDINGLLSYMKNIYDRKHRTFSQTKLEEDFVKKIQSALKQ